MSRNDRKCKYIFYVPSENLARKGLKSIGIKLLVPWAHHPPEGLPEGISLHILVERITVDLEVSIAVHSLAHIARGAVFPKWEYYILEMRFSRGQYVKRITCQKGRLP